MTWGDLWICGMMVDVGLRGVGGWAYLMSCDCDLLGLQ